MTFYIADEGGISYIYSSFRYWISILIEMIYLKRKGYTLKFIPIDMETVYHACVYQNRDSDQLYYYLVHIASCK